MSYSSSVKTKNILFVHYGDNWIRGSEVCLINLVNSLNRQEFNPIIWTNNEALFNHLDNTETCLHSSFHFLANELTPGTRFTSWQQQISEAIRVVKENDIDLIHVNSGAPCQWMVIASFLTKVPMVTQLHSDYCWRDRITFGLHLAPLLVTVSKAISHNLRREGVKERNLKVISNGCTAPNSSSQLPFNVKALLGLTAEDVLLVSVGSLIHRKGMDKLIKTIHLLKQEKNTYHLLIIGEGEKRDDLKALCNKLKVTERVHFAGEQHDVYRWLQGGPDMFISGARNEAFGLVLAEAALASLPVIAPNRDGIPEVLPNNHSALLYDDNSEQAIASLVIKLAKNPELQRRLSITAKLRVKEKFSIDANTRSFEKLYREVLSTPAIGTPRLNALMYPFSYALFTGLLSRLKRKTFSTFTAKETG